MDNIRNFTDKKNEKYEILSLVKCRERERENTPLGIINDEQRGEFKNGKKDKKRIDIRTKRRSAYRARALRLK